MALLNYTTKVDASKTIGEIQATLAKRGVRKMILDYDEQGNAIALTFGLMINNRLVAYSLPCRWEGVQKVLARDRKRVDKAQALRISWRNLKVWTEAQLALVDAEMATLPEVFLPYATTRDGSTLYEHFRDSDKSNLLLTQG